MTVTSPILVAEDDANDQRLLRRAMQKAGLAVQANFVSNGVEVLAYLESSVPLPSLLLLDLNMPRMSGFQVLECLRQRSHLRPAHVVIYSSSVQAEDIGRARCLGVDHYVVKPNDLSELAATVKRLEPYWTERALASMPTFEQPVLAAERTAPEFGMLRAW